MSFNDNVSELLGAIKPYVIGWIRKFDGWMPRGEVWSYVGSLSAKAVGDLMAEIQVGDKLKLTQTSVKYFYVTAKSYSLGYTTFTLVSATGGFTVANAAISDVFVSHMASPPGFPDATSGSVGDADTLDGNHAAAFLTSVTAHDLLSVTHGDTLAGSVEYGSIIVGNSTPKWSQLTHGNAGDYATSGGHGAAVSWTAPLISSANATDLTDGGDSTLHYHAADRNLANATNPTAPSAAWTAAVDARVSALSAETIDDRVAALLIADEGIDLTYDDAGNTLTVACEKASSSNLGAATFNADNFAVSVAGDVTVKDHGIALVEIVHVGAYSVLGNSSGSSGDVVGVALSGGDGITLTWGAGTLEIKAKTATSSVLGSATFSTDNFTVSGGDVTIKDKGVALAEMADIATDKLIGRDTGATGVPETIGVTGGIVFDGSGNIQTTAFTGDVTKALGGTALTIAVEAVTYAKMQHVSANKILGSVAGGDVSEIDCTAAGRALMDDATAAAQLATLGASPSFTYLTAAITSGTFDGGDDFSTTAKTLIDLSATFSGVPAGIKAVLVEVRANDSGSAATACSVRLSPNSTATEGPLIVQLKGMINDVPQIQMGLVPCDANGDIYYQIVATGANTLNFVIKVWGYQT